MFFNGPDNPQKLPLPLWESGSSSNTWFLGPFESAPNGISISSAVSADSQTRLTTNTDTQTDRQTDHATPSVAVGRYSCNVA